ncbi:hypothetical protein ABT160_23485 [Streptomyces sp. NPDC001941]|uniref:hypothetical protein n=1 Tax=Streptomyces sp. NPDC001941 TaxID=3154659 RepID=UPI0033274EB6
MSAEQVTPEAGEAPEEQNPNEPEQQRNSAGEAESPDPNAAELAALRARLAEAAPILQAHKDAEEAQKTEAQRLREALEAAERERDEARRVVVRAEVAEETGLTGDVVALLHGATKDELLAAAKTVAEQSQKRGGGLPSRPRANLKTGQEVAGEPEVTDPLKLAAAIKRRLSY